MATVTISNSKRIGDLTTWSVTDPATPNAPGDTNGNTGSVNFSARTGVDPEFIINDNYELEHETLGSVEGVIVSGSVSGATDATSTTGGLTGTTPLDLLNADRVVRPLTLGGPRTAIHESLLALGVTSLTGSAPNGGTYYPLLGSTQGYSGSYTATPPHGDLWQQFAINLGMGFAPTSLTTLTSADVGLRVTGQDTSGLDIGRLDTGVFTADGANLQYLVSTANVRISYIVGNSYQPPNYSDVFFWTLNTATNAYSIGIVDGGSSSGTYTVDDTQPLVVNIRIAGDTVSLSLTDHNGTTQTLSRTRASGTYANRKLYLGEFTDSTNSTTGNINLVGAKTYMGAAVNSYWTAETIGGLTWNSSTTTANLAIPGYNGNVFDHIKQVCTAFGVEFAATGSGYEVRDLGERSLSLDNVEAGSVSLSLTGRSTGRSVDFVNYNTTAGYGTVFDSLVAESMISVEAGETTTFTVVTTNSLTYVEQPRRITDVTLRTSGTYYVSASDNLPVVADQWEAYGASVSVAINPDNPNAIDITLVGPRENIPGVPGPYYFGASDGNTQYPIFSIRGSGVFTNEQTLNILSGADHAKVTTEVAFTVDNYCIVSKAMAYARCTWALARASGPILSLSATVPTSSIAGFGLTAGSVVEFKENQYRISEATIDKAWTNITAERCLTVGEFDAFSAGVTVGDFDAFWGTNECEDLKIRPLRSVT